MHPHAEQLAIVDGVRLNGVSNILVAEQVSRLPFARSRGRLYVLVEPLGERTGWENLCRQIVQTVHDEFYSTSGSITAGLRRAIDRANALLCDMNLAEERKAPRWAGLTAAVIRGNDLYLAQTGPALAYVVRGDVATRFPDDSPWLEMTARQATEEGYAAPLGLRHELSVDLFHTVLSVGDILVLAETQVAEYLQGADVAATFGDNSAESTTRLKALFADRDLSLLVVRAGGSDGGTPTRASGGRLSPLSETTTAVPAWHTTAAPPHAGPRPTDPQALLRDAGEGVARTAAGLSSRLGDTWRRMLPGSEQRRLDRESRRRPKVFGLPQATSKRPTDDRLVLIGMVAAVTVLAFVGYFLLRWQGGRVQEGRYERAIAAINEKIAAADNAATVEGERQALVEARVLTERTRDNPLADSRLTGLENTVETRLDALDAVRRLYWSPVLREYSEAGTYVSDLVVQGIDVYALDTGLGRVYKRLLNPYMDGLQEHGPDVPEILLRSGDERDGLTVGRLLDMAWVPAGPGRQWSSLLVLEQTGALLEYEPSTGIRVLAPAGRSGLQEPRAMAGYEGRILVADSKLNQILVFEPGSGAYDVAPVSYTSADLMLSGVVDIAVDGDVYLLYADGLVAKLRGGEQTSFQLTGLTSRIINPTAIYVTQDREGAPGSVYVADAGNRRVLRFTKDGQFVQQYTPRRGEEDLFSDLTGVYVDEAAQKMVLVTSTQVLITALPTD